MICIILGEKCRLIERFYSSNFTLHLTFPREESIRIAYGNFCWWGLEASPLTSTHILASELSLKATRSCRKSDSSGIRVCPGRRDALGYYRIVGISVKIEHSEREEESQSRHGSQEEVSFKFPKFSFYYVQIALSSSVSPLHLIFWLLLVTPIKRIWL